MFAGCGSLAELAVQAIFAGEALGLHGRDVHGRNLAQHKSFRQMKLENVTLHQTQRFWPNYNISPT